MTNFSVCSQPARPAKIVEQPTNQVATFYHAAVINRLPVALWRPPGAHSAQAIVDLSGQTEAADADFQVDFHDNMPTFVFSPFVKEQNLATLRLQADVHLDDAGLHTYGDIHSSVRHAENHRRFTWTYQALTSGELPTQPAWYTLPFAIGRNRIATEAEFRALVESAIDFIRATQISKIVVSRMTETALPPHFDPTHTFEQLCSRYPQAFVALVAIPDVGTWMCASPELLLALDQGELSTMALAGTQARPANLPLDQVRWGNKEVVEQALVSDYIREFFHKAGIDDLQETGPQTVAAGNVVHLQSTFHVHRTGEALLTVANQVLHKLHPTSAVCGMPKDKALSFILAEETYDRSFYSGFLGPVHVGGQSSLYVNLRCMQLQATTATLYVGAGITADSVPAAEWRETVLKSETLLNVLRTASEPPADPQPPVRTKPTIRMPVLER